MILYVKLPYKPDNRLVILLFKENVIFINYIRSFFSYKSHRLIGAIQSSS